ncbi:DUF502 domain-containing protein [Desulforudis sp. 1088]|uniref:DUF502 domain-containing protein n=1 Tax=unclassified Candidatus Desulforudis TaxID=2635950 RepID=UPI00348F692A
MSTRRYLVAGLAVVLPLAVTIWLLFAVFRFIDGVAGSLVIFLAGEEFHIPGLGILITLAVIFLAGVLATNIIGKRLLAFGENLLLRIPLASPVYRVSKQIFETLSKNNKDAFRQVGLVEWPRKGIWTIGFIAGESYLGNFVPEHPEVIRVFIPTVPNPTTGFMFMAPKDDVIILPISVEEGIKFLLSAGIVAPEVFSRKCPDVTGAEAENQPGM